MSRNLQTTLLFPLLCLINIQIRKRRARVALAQIDPIYHSGVNSFVSAFFASFHFPPFAFQTAKVQPTHRANAKSSLRALSANNHFVAPRVPDHLVPPRSLLKTCNNSLDMYAYLKRVRGCVNIRCGIHTTPYVRPHPLLHVSERVWKDRVQSWA